MRPKRERQRSGREEDERRQFRMQTEKWRKNKNDGHIKKTWWSEKGKTVKQKKLSKYATCFCFSMSVKTAPPKPRNFCKKYPLPCHNKNTKACKRTVYIITYLGKEEALKI